tara:strand:- start:1525 stop:1878 length:354 start_codon:yes stop_codon:yes gene_type:complete
LNIRANISDFINGFRVLVKGTRDSDAVGDKGLAYMSRIVAGQIDVYGARSVRVQVIKSIENDFKRDARKGSDGIEKTIQNALATPDYMRMLHRLGLEESHIRVMAMQALKDRERRTK